MLADWLDNPIFIKHVRSRLRRRPMMAAFGLMYAGCLCILVAGHQLGFLYNGYYFVAIFAVQSIVLVGVGAARISESVVKSRSSGLLAFHRLSPLTPTELTLGFFFGPPAREYLLAALALPFAVVGVAFGVPSFLGVVQMTVLLLFTAWLIHGAALLVALNSRATTTSASPVGVLVLAGLFAASTIAGMRQLVRLAEEAPRLDFFGFPLPWLAFVVIYFMAALAIMLLAVRRRMESERLPALSKPQALGAGVVLGLLTIGGAGNIDDPAARAVVVLYVLAVAGLTLASVAAPSRNMYVRGLRRSHELGAVEPPAWSDDALNRPFLACLCASLLVAGTLTLGGTRRQPGPAASSLAIALPVLVVGYYGLALQYFRLRLRAGAKGAFVLFLFAAWVVPLPVGIILLASRPGADEVARGVLALSPIPGVGMLLAPEGPDEGRRFAEAAAVTSSLSYLFVFNALVGKTKRMIRRLVLKAARHETDSPRSLDDATRPPSPNP